MAGNTIVGTNAEVLGKLGALQRHSVKKLGKFGQVHGPDKPHIGPAS